MSDKQTVDPVRYLQAGLWSVSPTIAQSKSFEIGVGLIFKLVPEALRDDAVSKAYVALLEQPGGLTEADALRVINLATTIFVQHEQRERGAVRRKKTTVWRRPVGVDQLVSLADPVRALELAQTEAAIEQLILSQPAGQRLAMRLLSDGNASPAERSVRHVRATTGLSLRTVTSLQKKIERLAAGLDLRDPERGLAPGTGAAVGLGKLSAAVAQRSVTPALRSSDTASYEPDKLGDRSSPRPRYDKGRNTFQ